jgi:hypothetical protein
MEMKKLSSLFERYQRILVPPQASVEKRVAEIICEITSLTIKPDQVSYSVGSKTISLKVPSVLKSELQHHKTTILMRLESEMGIKNSPKTIL